MQRFWLVFLLLCIESYSNASVAKKTPGQPLNGTQPDATSIDDQSKSVILSESGAIVKPKSSELGAQIENRLLSANKTIAAVPEERSHSRGITSTSNAVAPSAEQSDPSKETSENHALAVVDNLPIIPVHEDNPSAEVAAIKPMANNSTIATKPLTGQSQAAIVQPIVEPAKNTTSTVTKSSSADTTPIKLKPNVTVSVEDDREMMAKLNLSPGASDEQPIVESSREIDPRLLGQNDHDPYGFLFPAIGIIVMIPLLVMATNCAVRRARDYWSKRKYRRMDYLIEDMYN